MYVKRSRSGRRQARPAATSRSTSTSGTPGARKPTVTAAMAATCSRRFTGSTWSSLASVDSVADSVPVAPPAAARNPTATATASSSSSTRGGSRPPRAECVAAVGTGGRFDRIAEVAQAVMSRRTVRSVTSVSAARSAALHHARALRRLSRRSSRLGVSTPQIFAEISRYCGPELSATSRTFGSDDETRSTRHGRDEPPPPSPTGRRPPPRPHRRFRAGPPPPRSPGVGRGPCQVRSRRRAPRRGERPGTGARPGSPPGRSPGRRPPTASSRRPRRREQVGPGRVVEVVAVEVDRLERLEAGVGPSELAIATARLSSTTSVGLQRVQLVVQREDLAPSRCRRRSPRRCARPRSPPATGRDPAALRRRQARTSSWPSAIGGAGPIVSRSWSASRTSAPSAAVRAGRRASVSSISASRPLGSGSSGISSTSTPAESDRLGREVGRGHEASRGGGVALVEDRGRWRRARGGAGRGARPADGMR